MNQYHVNRAPRLKLLVVSNAYPPNIIGGGEYSAANLVRVMLGLGHDVSILTMAEPNEPEVWDALQPDGSRIFRMRFPRAFTPYRANKGDFAPTGLQWKFWNLQDYVDPRSTPIVARVVKHVDPEHINIHSLSGFGYNTLDALKRQAPITWILHDLSLSCTKGGMFVNGHPCVGQCIKCKVLSALKSHFIRKVPRLVFVSPSKINLETVQRYTAGVRERPGLAIANVPDLLPPLMPQYHPDPAGQCRILFVGRLHVTKGLDVVLNALEGLESRYNFSITILGRGPEEAELKARYGHHAWFKFGGFVSQDDVTRAIPSHDLLVTPSIWAEPYGRVTAQALQLGTPVFGSDIGGTKELVRHEVTGLLIEPGNVEAWRQQFIRVFSDPSILLRWRQQTKNYVHEFDETRISEQYTEAINTARRIGST